MKQHQTIARAMTALSHPRRVALFDIMEEAGPSGIGFDDLLRQSGFGLTSLRHHLRPMQAAGLVIRTREGVNVIFRLHGAAMRAATEGIAKRLYRLPPMAPVRIDPPPLT